MGGRIVAEVFLGLIFGDANSVLNIDPNFVPMKPGFALKDFVGYALGLYRFTKYRWLQGSF